MEPKASLRVTLKAFRPPSSLASLRRLVLISQLSAHPLLTDSRLTGRFGRASRYSVALYQHLFRS